MIWEPTPGEWTHRGLDCEVHGVNVPHCRPLQGAGRTVEGVGFTCVACKLEMRTTVEAQAFWEAT